MSEDHAKPDIVKGLEEIAAAMAEDDGERRAYKIISPKYLAMTRGEIMEQSPDFTDKLNIGMQGGFDALYQDEFWAVVKNDKGNDILEVIHDTGYPEDNWVELLTEKIKPFDPDVRVVDLGAIKEYTGTLGYARQPFHKSDRYDVLTRAQAVKKYEDFLRSNPVLDDVKNTDAKDNMSDMIKQAAKNIRKKGLKPPGSGK